MEQLVAQNDVGLDAYTIFVYSLRSPYTKESYFRRLLRFFDFIDLDTSADFQNRCNLFVEKALNDPDWAFVTILRFIQFHKERVERNGFSLHSIELLMHSSTFFMSNMDMW